MKKYRTTWGTSIEEVEIERETANQVIFPNGRRALKRTEHHRYHDTWERAHQSLLSKAERTVQLAIRNLERAKSNYENIKGMPNPEGDK